MSYHHIPLSAERKALINKRAVVRYQCAPATPGKMLILEDREYQRGWVLDLSTVGLGLEVTRPVPVCSLVLVRLKSPHTGKFYDLSAQVAHCTPKITGEYIVGCKLITTLNEDDLDALL